MGSSEHNRGIMLSLIDGKMLNLHGGIFHLNLSEYYNQISDFTNQIFVTSSLRYSIFLLMSKYYRTGALITRSFICLMAYFQGVVNVIQLPSCLVV